MNDRQPFRLFALLALFGALIALFSQWALIIIALGYLVSGVLARVTYSWTREHSHTAG